MITKNASAIRLYADLLSKSLHTDILRLENIELTALDFHKINYTPELIEAVQKEAEENIWFYFRELINMSGIYPNSIYTDFKFNWLTYTVIKSVGSHSENLVISSPPNSGRNVIYKALLVYYLLFARDHKIKVVFESTSTVKNYITYLLDFLKVLPKEIVNQEIEVTSNGTYKIYNKDRNSSVDISSVKTVLNDKDITGYNKILVVNATCMEDLEELTKLTRNIQNCQLILDASPVSMLKYDHKSVKFLRNIFLNSARYNSRVGSPGHQTAKEFVKSKSPHELFMSIAFTAQRVFSKHKLHETASTMSKEEVDGLYNLKIWEDRKR